MDNSSSSTSSTSSPSVSTTNIGYHNLDNLPDDIYDFYLFKCLHVADLFRLKLVSKRLNSIVKSYKIKELSFLDFGCELDCSKNLLSPAKYRYLFDLSRLHLLIKPFDGLLNLRDLRIYGDLYSEMSLAIRLKDLNKFTKLRILELCHFSLGSNDDHLQLFDLRALRIQFCKDDNGNTGRVSIDTPKLERLEYFKCCFNRLIEQIDFKHPNSLKHLIVADDYRSLSILSCLECLELYVCSEDELSMIDRVLEMKNLSKFRINYISYYNAHDESINKLKTLFRLKRDNLEVVLYGVKIGKIGKFDEFTRDKNVFEHKCVENLKFQILDNYRDLEDDLHFVTTMKYAKLIDLLPNNLPDDFFKKFTNIQELIIESKIEDENRLINFIRECGCLNRLEIKRSSLSQQFFDRLPAASSLTYLEVKSLEFKLNFGFIIKMHYLYELRTDQEIKISKKLNLNNLYALKSILFKVNGQYFALHKEAKDRYRFYDAKSNKNLNFNKFNKLIKWFKVLRNSKNENNSTGSIVNLTDYQF